MLEGGFRVVGSVRFLSSMVFSNSPNGAFTSPVAFWSSADDVHRIAIVVTAMAGLALAASLVYTRRRSLKSPWSHRRRKHALSPQEWRSMFTSDGKLQDGGVKFLKKVRSGGVDPSIRAKVWPFLLGFYDLNSSEEERNAIRTHKRKEYENLRRRCHWLLQQCESFKKSEEVGGSGNTEIYSFNEESDSLDSEGGVGANQSLSAEEAITDHDESNRLLDKEASEKSVEEENSDISNINVSAVYTESSGGESSVEESESTQMLHDADVHGKNGPNCTKTNPVNDEGSKVQMAEDFSTWRRIIHLDAVRANAEWIDYSPNQASVSEGQAQRLANSVRLKDYNHLEPCRVFHAARLVAILEAYSLYDPEIGYCQGMSDLLAPIVTVIEEDFEAFWCFVGFMRKARHNFRLDEVGIRRQLSLVSKIIKSKDSHLYNHLEKLQAEDCFFVYRMVVVLFRRELTFEQTLCLWEVMWADQAAIRAGIGKSAWGRMRLRAPPTEDLLLYAIAACVLKKRKLIIEKYSSMEEIMRECNDMAGQLDVWKLLDDAYDLVVTLHDKV